jgi:hypothetical protein
VSTTTAMPADVDRWGRLVRRTGIAGLISVGMLFAPFPALSILGKGEPPLTATAEQARDYFTNGSVGWAQMVTVVPKLAAIGLICSWSGWRCCWLGRRASRPGDRVSPWSPA